MCQEEQICIISMKGSDPAGEADTPQSKETRSKYSPLRDAMLLKIYKIENLELSAVARRLNFKSINVLRFNLFSGKFDVVLFWKILFFLVP